MKKPASLIATSAMLLALVACSSSADDAADTATSEPTAPSTSASPTPTPAPTPTPSPTPEIDALAACSAFMDGGDTSVMFRVPPALSSIGGTITDAQVDELLDLNRALTAAAEISPAPLAAALTNVNVPFQQAADVFAAGGGELTMDTSDMLSKVTKVVELCGAEGFAVS